MKRPVWAGSPTFHLAWGLALAERDDGVFSEEAGNALHSLSGAHVVAIDREQVEALPELGDRAEILLHERLCFDPLYIDMSFARESRFGEKVGETDAELLGVLCATRPHPEIEGIGLIGFIRSRENGSFMVPILVGSHQTPDGPSIVYLNPAAASVDADPPARSLAAMAARALCFLACSNLELVEAPASRQERRAAQRNGGRIALTVQVKRPRRAPADSENPVRRDYSHRFEVAGHYRRIKPGKSPDQKLSWDSELQRYVRRVWVPNYVKGPDDKPLVLKTRIARNLPILPA